MEKLYSTGEAANLLGVKVRDADYALQRGRGGKVLFVGGRRALTAANVRQLAKHFGKSVPTECLEDADAAQGEVLEWKLSVCGLARIFHRARDFGGRCSRGS